MRQNRILALLLALLLVGGACCAQETGTAPISARFGVMSQKGGSADLAYQIGGNFAWATVDDITVNKADTILDEKGRPYILVLDADTTVSGQIWQNVSGWVVDDMGQEPGQQTYQSTTTFTMFGIYWNKWMFAIGQGLAYEHKGVGPDWQTPVMVMAMYKLSNRIGIEAGFQVTPIGDGVGDLSTAFVGLNLRPKPTR